jgi:hypothetical protein
VIKKFINPNENLYFIEISSGSGQHLAHFAPHFPKCIFQPTEFDPSLFGSIEIYADECLTKNMKRPVRVDISTDMGHQGFEPGSIDVLYNANMMHISPFECTTGLFENAGMYLKANGIMITYGPYAVDGVLSPQSNVEFDKSLRSRDSRWGIRDLAVLRQLAEKNAINLSNVIEMPANNKCLIWEKISNRNENQK